MELGAHVPPWRVEKIENYQGQTHLVGAAIVNAGVMIAEVRGATFIHGQPHGEHVAVANLLSAAPDMFDALQALSLIRPSNWADGEDPEQEAAWKALDAALAKAAP